MGADAHDPALHQRLRSPCDIPQIRRRRTDFPARAGPSERVVGWTTNPPTPPMGGTNATGGVVAARPLWNDEPKEEEDPERSSKGARATRRVRGAMGHG
jgi:hypothetical protein